MSKIQGLASPHAIHNLCKTVWTVGMSENAIGRHRAMGLSVRPSCNPTLMIKGMSGLVSNESAHTADGEQRRLSSRSGRCFMNNLSKHGFISHAPPPSIILHQARPRAATRRDANPHDQGSCSRTAVYGTGKPPSSPTCREHVGSGIDATVLTHCLQCLTVRHAYAVYRTPWRVNEFQAEPPVRPHIRREGSALGEVNSKGRLII